MTKFFCIILLIFCGLLSAQKRHASIEIWETNSRGKSMQKVAYKEGKAKKPIEMKIFPEQKFQKIIGFGGAFTESTTYLLSKLSNKNRQKILQSYFSEQGARYSLCRTHINSCDFSLSHYAYAMIPNDRNLDSFSIARDEQTIIPIIKEAQKISKNGFQLIASPWTAPPWMKDNNNWVGGKLKQEYYNTWALYYTKYLNAYKKHNINFWGITVINEPHGNGNNWESMLFSPQEMTHFVKNHLGPQLKKDYPNIAILGYDQNRIDLKNWVDEMYKNQENAKYYDGVAVHWYDSTYDFFPNELQYAHQKSPNKYIIQTEACIDAEIPVWKNDTWYWQKNATDWGYDWAPEHQKSLHPKYVPVYRYADDIIGCMNNYVQGWIDWNMVLNKQGGPNWFKNWCIAPIIVDEQNDQIYFTPLYYTMVHFSKFIRPDAVRIGFKISTDSISATAFKNKDNSIVLVVLNKDDENKFIKVELQNHTFTIQSNKESIQTIIINL